MKQRVDNLDQYLAEKESAYTDLVQGTERTIRWYDKKQQTKYSIVYLHGFSASKGELSPVTERVADKLQANVYYARLRGHGRSSEAMAEASMDDWINDAKEAYEIGAMIGERVIIISTSTGGTLATWLTAQHFTENIAANVMLSPNFGIRSWSGELLRWSWGLRLAKWMNGDYHSFTPQNELHSKYWTERYPYEALVPMVNLVDQVLELDKSTISSPQLIIYSPNDQVVDATQIPETALQFTNAEVTLHPFTSSTDSSQHVLAGDACAPESTNEVVTIISDYLTNQLE